MKKHVTRSLNDYLDLADSVDSLIARLNELKKKYPGKDLRISKEYGYEDCVEWKLEYDDLETDAEFLQRQAEENRWKQMQLENARKILKAAGELK